MTIKTFKRILLITSSLVLATGLLAGCGAKNDVSIPDVGRATEKYAEFMPKGSEILAYVEDLANLDMRQSGAAGGVQAQEYIMDKFNEYGLEDVHVIPTETDLWTCDDWTLQVEGQTIDSYRMYMSLFDGKYGEGGELKANAEGVVSKDNGVYGTFSTSDKGNVEDAEIIYIESLEQLEETDPAEVKGKVVVSNIKSRYAEPLEYYYAQAYGAVGFVGILKEYFDSNKYNPEDMSYVNGSFLIPGYYVTKKDGDKIIDLIAEAENREEAAQAHFEMTVNVERTDKAGAVVGILPGKSDGDGKMIMMESHYDATTPDGATQDASGCSVVLALAKFYSQIPQEERERGILFVLNDTHSSDYDAHDNVNKEYLGGEWIEEEACSVPGINETDVLAVLGIEHISEEAVIEDNELKFTGNVSEHYTFVADSPEMMQIVTDETANLQDAKETGIATVQKAEAIVTDADLFWYDGWGIPVVSMISHQPYMFDDCDTIDKVPERALKPVTESFANIIWKFMSLDESCFDIPKPEEE